MHNDHTPEDAATPQPFAEDPSTGLLGGAMVIALLHRLHAQHTATMELVGTLDEWVAPKPLPPFEPVLAEPAPARPWGVTERPKRITWDFCFRLRWRTWPDDQKRFVPSAASRSQYLRVGSVIYAMWGEKLDKAGASFQKLRWIAATEDAVEREVRFQRVMSGEKLSDVMRAKPAEPPPLDEKLARIAEEDLSRIAGREIRVPRQSTEAAGAKEAPRKRGRPRGSRSR